VDFAKFPVLSIALTERDRFFKQDAAKRTRLKFGGGPVRGANPAKTGRFCRLRRPYWTLL